MVIDMDRSLWPDVNHPEKLYQTEVRGEDKEQWKKKWEAVENEYGIWTIGRKTILPKRYLMPITRWFHDKAHEGIEVVVNQVQQVWAVPGVYAAAKRIINSCPTCQKFSHEVITRTRTSTMGLFPICHRWIFYTVWI